MLLTSTINKDVERGIFSYPEKPADERQWLSDSETEIPDIISKFLWE